MLPGLVVAESNSMHGLLHSYEMRKIAFARLFVLFSNNYKQKLCKALFTQKRIYYFAQWAAQLVEDCLD